MILRKIAILFKRISFALLSWQSDYLQKRLKTKYGYSPNATIKGCTLELKDKEKATLELLNKEVRDILKRHKDDTKQILNFIEEHGTQVIIAKNAKKFLNAINERPGLITERTGFNALIINYLTDNGLKFKTKPMIILDSDEISLYYIACDLHRWCALKNKMPGFDEKSQRLLLQINNKNEDKIISKLSSDDISNLLQAIARKVQAIDFVSVYAKESQAARKVLEKIKSEGNADV